MYRAISEGVINLADCFFDMEYLDASKGLEIYKQSIADNERLSNFYAQASSLLACPSNGLGARALRTRLLWR